MTVTLVRCQGYGPSGIKPHMVASVNANNWCSSCTEAYNAGNNAITSNARVIAVKRGLPVPIFASDRLTRKRAASLGWKPEQIKSVFRKAESLIGIKKESIDFRAEFDRLPIPRRGTVHGDGNYARNIVSNPGERAAEREARVKAILEEKWPAPEYRIEDNTKGAGADFLIWKRVVLVAKADAKSSPTITRRQLKEARKGDAPFWLVGTNFKLEVTKDVKLIPTAYRVYAN